MLSPAVILSEVEVDGGINSAKHLNDRWMRFFTSLRSVQNDNASEQ